MNRKTMIKILSYIGCMFVLISSGISMHLDFFNSNHFIIGIICDILILCISSVFTVDFIYFFKKNESK